MDITIKDANGEQKTDRFFIDEPCVVSFFIGELGWLVQRWQGYLRHLKTNVYKDHKFFLMLNGQYHILVQDFVNWSMDLPEEFYRLGLETDCYEAPWPNSPSGALTPPEVWTRLIEYMRQFYNPEKAVEIWTPRGVNTWIDMQPQLFLKYTTEALVQSNRPIITVFPRGRSRASFRNVPEYVWQEVVEGLRQKFDVVLCGTPSGACLVDYKASGVENLIGKADVERVLHLLNNSVCSISSQSGPTHLSVLGMCPSYIIGHEQERHTIAENRFGTPTSFRYVQDYRAIDAPTILNDIQGFIQALIENDEFNSRARRTMKPMTRYLTNMNKPKLKGAILEYNNVPNIGNIVNLLDIDSLYLIGQPPKGEAMNELTDRITEYGNESKVHFIATEASEAIDMVPDELDFVYSDAILPPKICDDYFYKLKAGGVFGSGELSKWQQYAMPFPFRRVYGGIECDLYSRYGKDAPLDGWFIRMGGILRESFKNLQEKKNLVGAEIGVFYGENSKSLLENLHMKHLYLIDPYEKGLVGIQQENAPDFVLQNAKRLLEKYEDKTTWIRKKSKEALTDLPKKLDFVYIDGDHSYEGAKSDIELYWPKIKKGGLLGGHDYDNSHVKKAVDEFFDKQKNDYVIFTAYDVDNTLEFWVYKIDNLFQDVVKEGYENLNKLIKDRNYDV